MNIQKMMKQAQEMQQKMEELKAKMAKTEYEGQSGGGMVKAKFNGEGQMISISIDDSLMEKDEKEMLEDLIVAATNDAKSKVEADSQNQMSSALGGMNLPSGFKMPF